MRLVRAKNQASKLSSRVALAKAAVIQALRHSCSLGNSFAQDSLRYCKPDCYKQ